MQAAVIILPTIGSALNIPESRQQWVVSAYSLTFGCFLVRFQQRALRSLTLIGDNSYCGED